MLLFLPLFVLCSPPDSVPVADHLGVCFHLNETATPEYAKMRAAGFAAVRTDLDWSGIESKKGVYDWTKYDRAVAAIRAAGLHPLLILDYGNPFYGDGPPRTDEARAAFAAFAGAAARRYADAGADFEIWNEPNHRGFWKPEPNAEDYVALAKATSAAIRVANPKARILGPAATEPIFPFLKECFALGLLDVVDAVSIHPYRPQRPESLRADVLRLRSMIAGAHPPKPIGIEFTEMGYPMTYPGQDEERRAAYIARAFFVSVAAGVDRVYLYQWKEKNEKESGGAQHGFGLYDESLKPLPSGTLLRKLMDALEGFAFERRVSKPASDDLVLSFVKGTDRRYVVWTAARDPADGAAVARLPGRLPIAQAAQATVAGRSVDLSDVPKVVTGR